MNMMEMLGKLKEMQSKIKEAQDNLVHITAEAESGGGMVKAIVNGKKQVIKIEVDQTLCKPDDKEMMQDLIIAAINKAMEEVEGKAQEEMQKHTQGMLPNIPGMDFGF
ncbi:YbaB/EbfC family nucleoid-associated protein [Limibacter armeniacum]|uniref:YbaB/EbfC family nucleoid-associated protein n=1 Tax=Limibacter armeniacum TaxID=466084 RepID=UPI002FE5CC20